jgi:hypothetical protein
MKRAGLAGLVVLLSSVGAPARSCASWHAAIARVRIEARRDRVRVTTDVIAWTGERQPLPLSVYAAYGAPGPPLAADAELLAVPRGYLDAPEGAAGERLGLSFSPTAPGSTDLALGSPRMAGSAITASAGQLAAALAPTGAACIRLTSVRPMPPPGPSGAHEIIVRLGSRAGAPFVLDEVEVAGRAVEKSDVELCEGRDVADRRIATTPARDAGAGAPPALAARSASDALCVRLWLTQR